MSARTYAAVSLVVSALAISFGACGGTVVFEEGTGGGDGDGDGDGANTSASQVTVTSTQAGPTSVGSVTPAGPGGGTDDVVSVGQGPGPGPGQGGANPTGAGGEGPGPSGVGGADVGPAGAVSVTSGGGCNGTLEQTQQYCYMLESCQFYELEIECGVGNEPSVCWCYENGEYLGQCAEGEVTCDVYGGCCGAYWKLPG